MQSVNKVKQLNKQQHIIKRINQILLRMNKPEIAIVTPLFNTDILELCDLDSLGFMEFLSAIEEEFDFEFSEDIEYSELINFNSLLTNIYNTICSH